METEARRLPVQHRHVLLREDFHRSLLACSLEIVIFSYGLAGMEAPWYAWMYSLDVATVCTPALVRSGFWMCLSSARTTSSR